MAGEESLNRPPDSEPSSSEFWREIIGRFVQCTDAVCLMRARALESTFAQLGIKIDDVLEQLDATTGEQQTVEANAYVRLKEEFATQESDIAYRATRLHPEKYMLHFMGPGQFIQSEIKAEDNEQSKEYRSYFIRDSKLYETTFSAPADDEWDEEMLDLFSEGVDTGAIPQRELSQEEAAKLVTFMEMAQEFIERYVYAEFQ